MLDPVAPGRQEVINTQISHFDENCCFSHQYLRKVALKEKNTVFINLLRQVPFIDFYPRRPLLTSVGVLQFCKTQLLQLHDLILVGDDTDFHQPFHRHV